MVNTYITEFLMIALVHLLAVASPGPDFAQAGYGLYMALATVLWFILVAVIFGSERVRSSFSRIGHWFERIIGTLLVGLGLKLAVSSAS